MRRANNADVMMLSNMMTHSDAMMYRIRQQENTMNFKKTLLAVSLTLVSQQAFSAAFQLAEHSASGLGRAFAGDAAIAENASVVARNPALMTQFDNMQLSVVATYVKPDVSLKGESAPYGLSADVLNEDSIAPSAVVPAAYFTMPINDEFAIGFGAFSNFGLATEFNDDYAAGQLAGNTEITTVNLNSSLAYRVNEVFSVAIGINYIYADATIKRTFGASPLPIPAQTQAVNLEGDDTGYGFNIGFAYDVKPGHRYGFHYRSETDITFDGTYSNQLPAQLGGLAGQSLPGSVEITLPAIAEFSGSHQLNSEFGLHYSILWTGWTSFDKLEAYVEGRDAPVFSKTEDFTSSFRVALGGDYQFNEALKLRAGLAYDESPAEQSHLSISIPDTNRLWLSAGLTYQLDAHSSVDVGMSALRGETQNFTESDNLGQSWGFESKGHAYLVGAQYNYQF